MPGGSPAAWPHVKEIFQGISAKVDDGVPCCDWVGEGGAGHYVKMVHNGIEYGDMQLICEAYNIMKNGLGMTADEMHEVFAEWNKGDLDSYLIEITRDILAKKDEDGAPLVDKILDTAGQKGTGKWTVINSQELGIPITLMAEAVYSRCVSALKDERVKAAKKLKGPSPALKAIASNPEKKKAFIEDIRHALYASKIVSYAQGYMLMRAAAKEYSWNLNYGGIALMWRGGCIIRSRFLGKIKEAYDNNPKLSNLLLDDYFRGEIKKSQKGWRNVVATAAKKGIPVPAFSTALAFFDQYRTRRPAGEPAPGAARLLRRAHLRARGQAARRVLPHELDRPRRRRVEQHLHGLGAKLRQTNAHSEFETPRYESRGVFVSGRSAGRGGFHSWRRLVQSAGVAPRSGSTKTNAMKIDAALSPLEIDLLPGLDLTQSTAVVFDVLLTASSMVTALANGVTAIYPVTSMQEAQEVKSLLPGALLAGERHGLRFDGFDLGNSPLEYRNPSADRIISLTTNASNALRACAKAGKVLVGSLLNMGALVAHLRETNPANLLLVCAGTVREPALEDLFAAGMVCSYFQEAEYTDAARITASVFRKYQEDVLHCLHDSRKGRELMADNRREDVRWCTHRSLYAVIVQMVDGVVFKV